MNLNLIKNRILIIILFSTLLLLGLIFTNTNNYKPAITQSTTIQELFKPEVIQLNDETIKRGINFVHTQISKKISGLDEALGSGACAFDMDNDNDMDIYIVGGSGAQRFYGKKAWWSSKHTGHLYRNNGDGFFEEITEQAGLSFEFWGMGCNVADFDLNGHIDLLITGRKENVLYKNMNGQFTKVNFDNDTSWSSSAAIGDYNNDGLMDIYVGNYLKYDKTAKHFESLSGYDAGITQFRPSFYQGISNYLYTNKGGFKFNSNANELNIANPDGRTLSAKWFDANNDNWLDLIVFNDSGSSTQLYINNKAESFDKAPFNKRIDLPNGIRGGALSDYDNDGDADFILSTSLGDPVALLNKQLNSYKNTLWQQHDNSEVFSGYSGFGIQFIDLNNDGHQDIYHGNGLSRPDPDAKAVSIGQPDVISMADTNGRFIIPKQVTTNSIRYPISTRSVIKVDIDNDGDKDILLTSNNNPTRLLVNNTPISNWLGISLVDKYGNKGNYKHIVIKTNKKQRTFFSDNDTFLGRHDHRINLALANSEEVKSLSVFWRDGDTSKFNKINKNTYNIIKQDENTINQYGNTTQKNKNKTPARLAIWQIKAQTFSSNEILFAYTQANLSEKIEIIGAIGKHDKSYKLLSILKQALKSNHSSIVIAAINVFKDFEFEKSYYWLAQLFNHKNPQVLCSVANTFRHFYIEEEAFILRKSLAVPHLIQLIPHSNPIVSECAILALAESKSVRAVDPIKQTLLSSDNNTIKAAAIYALGELRHTESINALLQQTKASPQVQEKLTKALHQLNLKKDITQLSLEPKASNATSNNQKKCIKVSSNRLIKQTPIVFAKKLNSCSPIQLQSWLNINKETLEKNPPLFLENAAIKMSLFKELVNALKNSKATLATKALIIQLQKQTILERKLIIINSLAAKLPHPAAKKVLHHILSNKAKQKILRIAAGDALVESKPKLVMQYSNELFNESD